jgi:hypothetical protein
MRIFLLSLWLTPLVVFGSLSWQQKVINYKAAYGEESAKVSYVFTNTGTYAIRIFQAKTSCGCTVAKSDKVVYLPGESGQIDVTFNFEGRIGHQSKEIGVITDDNKSPVTTLVLNTDIPYFLTVEPQLVYWHKGDKPLPKTVLVTVMADDPIFIKGISSDDPNFQCELDRLELGRRYGISITPKSLDSPASATITLTTDEAGRDNKPATATISARIY